MGGREIIVNPGNNGVSFQGVLAVFRNAGIRDNMGVRDYCVRVRSALKNGGVICACACCQLGLEAES